MYYVMSNKTDIIIVAIGNVNYHQSIGFKIDSSHRTLQLAESAASNLETV